MELKGFGELPSPFVSLHFTCSQCCWGEKTNKQTNPVSSGPLSMVDSTDPLHSPPASTPFLKGAADPAAGPPGPAPQEALTMATDSPCAKRRHWKSCKENSQALPDPAFPGGLYRLRKAPATPQTPGKMSWDPPRMGRRNLEAYPERLMFHIMPETGQAPPEPAPDSPKPSAS